MTDTGKPKPPKVFWKPDEALSVAVKALDSLNAGNEKHFIDALLNAQALVLPQHRQRPKSTLITLTKKLREIAKIAIEQREIDRVEDAQQQTAMLEAQRHENKIAAERINHTPVHATAMPGDFLDDCIENIAQKFKASLLTRLRAMVEEAFDEIGQGVAVKINSTTALPEVRVKKLKVVVVGFRSDQGHDIIKGMNNTMDLKVISTIGGEGINELKRLAPTADFVLVNGKFVGHNHQEIVRKHPGFKLMDGGVTSCIKRLNELLINGK